MILSTALSACGGSADSPAPQPFTEQAVVAAFRKQGVEIPVVLRAGKSCKSEHWPLPSGSQSAKAARLYACGRLAQAHVETTNLPLAVMLPNGFAALPNYLITVYPDQNHAASLDFWLRRLFVPKFGEPFQYGPVSVLRKGNLVVTGFMRKSEIATTNRVFDSLRL